MNCWRHNVLAFKLGTNLLGFNTSNVLRLPESQENEILTNETRAVTKYICVIDLSRLSIGRGSTLIKRKWTWDHFDLSCKGEDFIYDTKTRKDLMIILKKLNTKGQEASLIQFCSGRLLHSPVLLIETKKLWMQIEVQQDWSGSAPLHILRELCMWWQQPLGRVFAMPKIRADVRSQASKLMCFTQLTLESRRLIFCLKFHSFDLSCSDKCNMWESTLSNSSTT